MRYLLILCLASCSATPALREGLMDFEAGYIDKGQYIQQTRSILDAAELSEGLRPRGGIPTDPLSLITYLAGAAGTLATAVVGTKAIKKRKVKSERLS